MKNELLEKANKSLKNAKISFIIAVCAFVFNTLCLAIIIIKSTL